MSDVASAGAPSIALYDYWRSSAAYRVRIALRLKGIAYEARGVDLRAGEQRGAIYLALNPQGLVPTIEVERSVLTQSSAILEWLEERFPDPPLLPPALTDRAVIRAMAATIGCDIHPLNNLRVLKTLRDPLAASEAAILAWIAGWIEDGFGALEGLISRHGGRYAFGDTPTLADCYLTPQVYSAKRFDVDLSDFPRLLAAVEMAQTHPAFVAAHPDSQADAPV